MAAQLTSEQREWSRQVSSSTTGVPRELTFAYGCTTRGIRSSGRIPPWLRNTAERQRPMPRFAYSALDARGAEKSGLLTTTNGSRVYLHLR